jgi:hypothetical protein
MVRWPVFFFVFVFFLSRPAVAHAQILLTPTHCSLLRRDILRCLSAVSQYDEKGWCHSHERCGCISLLRNKPRAASVGSNQRTKTT